MCVCVCVGVGTCVGPSLVFSILEWGSEARSKHVFIVRPRSSYIVRPCIADYVREQGILALNSIRTGVCGCLFV